ncbi:MAG: hypothetical protein SGCHY_003066 [Lobulomycetales sp.]
MIPTFPLLLAFLCHLLTALPYGGNQRNETNPIDLVDAEIGALDSFKVLPALELEETDISSAPSTARSGPRTSSVVPLKTGSSSAPVSAEASILPLGGNKGSETNPIDLVDAEIGALDSFKLLPGFDLEETDISSAPSTARSGPRTSSVVPLKTGPSSAPVSAEVSMETANNFQPSSASGSAELDRLALLDLAAKYIEGAGNAAAQSDQEAGNDDIQKSSTFMDVDGEKPVLTLDQLDSTYASQRKGYKALKSRNQQRTEDMRKLIEGEKKKPTRKKKKKVAYKKKNSAKHAKSKKKSSDNNLPPKRFDSDGNEVFEVGSVLQISWVGGKRRCLIHWKGYPAAYDKWIDCDDLTEEEKALMTDTAKAQEEDHWRNLPDAKIAAIGTTSSGATVVSWESSGSRKHLTDLRHLESLKWTAAREAEKREKRQEYHRKRLETREKLARAKGIEVDEKVSFGGGRMPKEVSSLQPFSYWKVDAQ